MHYLNLAFKFSYDYYYHNGINYLFKFEQGTRHECSLFCSSIMNIEYALMLIYFKNILNSKTCIFRSSYNKSYDFIYPQLNHVQNLSSSSTPPINYHHQLTSGLGHHSAPNTNSYPAPTGTPDSPLPLNTSASDKSSSIGNSTGNGGNGNGNNGTGNGPTQRQDGKIPPGTTVNQLLRRAEAQRRRVKLLILYIFYFI